MELSELHNNKGQVQDVTLMQHNAITSGAYSFTACQMDILFMLLANLGKEDKPNQIYTIHIKDIEALTGRQWNYQQLADSSEAIGSRVFKIQTGKSLKQIWLFSMVEYREGTGSFDVRISYDGLPFFFELKNNFTRFQLKSALACDSRYAKRIYTLACQWRTAGVVYSQDGKPYLTIPELKEKLGIENEYKLFSDLKRKVLEIARKQINKNTDVNIEYEYLKRGRSFYAVKILVNPVKPTQLEIPFDDEKAMKRLKAIHAFAPYGIKAVDVEKMLENDTAEKAWQVITATIKKVRSGKMEPLKDPGAYFATSFRNQGFL